MKIIAGNEYLLDGVNRVKVVKALNRANSVFCVESGSGLQTVDLGRLTSIEDGEENVGGGNLEGTTVNNSLANALDSATEDHYDYE